MEKRIGLESRRKKPAEVDTLNLDNCRSTSIVGLTEDFVSLTTLSMIGVGLTSLKGFPRLVSLTKLELSDNRIVGGLQVLKDCDSLEVLNLSNNKIKDVDAIEPLKELKLLRSLDLSHNDINQIEEYRNKVFEMLPGLTYLDGFDKDGKEPEESESEDYDSVVGTNGKVFGSKGESGSIEDLIEEEEEADVDDAGDDVEEESEEDDGEEEVVGLKDIYREDLDKESDDGDYDEEDEEVTEDEDEDLDDSHDVSGVSQISETGEKIEEEDLSLSRGKKRQHEDDDDDSTNVSGTDGKLAGEEDDSQGRGKKRQCEDDEDSG